MLVEGPMGWQSFKSRESMDGDECDGAVMERSKRFSKKDRSRRVEKTVVGAKWLVIHGHRTEQ